jgi:hypothetical protein
MSRDHHPRLRDVTADTENTATTVVACWTVFTELLPGSALIKSVYSITNDTLLCFITFDVNTYFARPYPAFIS